MAAVLATDGIVSSLPSRRSVGLAPTARGPDARDRQRGRSRPGLIVHHTSLHPQDITRRHGIPVTSAARTLLDIAATEPTAELERALNEAASSGASALIPSMSSSAVTRTTEERQH